jgi:hypothetical protein
MKLMKQARRLGQKKRTKNWFIFTKRKNFHGNKSQKKFLRETKRCVTVVIEDWRVGLRYNGLKRTMRN